MVKTGDDYYEEWLNEPMKFFQGSRKDFLEDIKSHGGLSFDDIQWAFDAGFIAKIVEDILKGVAE